MKITSSVTTKSASDIIMSGKEQFRIEGSLLSPLKCAEIIAKCQGLSKHWHCLEKAMIVRQVLNTGCVVIGSCHLWSADMKSNYGYMFKPPFEFHAWLQTPQGIIDVALPGAIEKGLTTFDDVGPYLIGREPFILAGPPLDWMEYMPVQIVG